jgi:Transmembrane protein of unknown function (DUF3556)
MGFITPEVPNVDHDAWHTLPRVTRLQVVTRHWVEHGFGAPYAVYLLYLLKIALYFGGAAAIISLTPGLGRLGQVAEWWTQPIVYQKAVIFTLLFEVLGLGCGSGPLIGRFWPPIGGLLYWLRPNTIRLPPWPGKVPFTTGDTRAVIDVALYAIVLISGVWALLAPGYGGSVTDSGDVGPINPMLVVPTIVALALLGLRDKTIFLALEWNVFFIFSLFYLFGHYGTTQVTDLQSPLLLAVLITWLAVVLIAGNIFLQQISFLPAMRYYAGNWATSIWCFRAGAEEKVEANIVKSSALVAKQLAKLYGPDAAEIMIDKVAAFRSMHTHGRALNGLLPRAVDNEADYAVRDGEIVAGPLLGWNFGEGYLHNEQLLEAVQRRCQFDEGDLRVVILEGQPIHTQQQSYRIVDAKAGLIEKGHVTVEDMLTRQPWPEPGDAFPVYLAAHSSDPAPR